MVQLGVLTTEFERPSLEDNLDAVASHGIGAVQFQLGSAVPGIPLRTSLEMGLDALGPHLNEQLCDGSASSWRPGVSPWPRSTAHSTWWARTWPGAGRTSVTSGA